MDVKELNPEELQHEHPLTLVDLQLMHRDYIEYDEEYDDKDFITTQNFKCICNRCDRRIDWYHRYYYKCSMSSCTYSLHKFCEEIPPTLKFQGHPSHTLILKRTTNEKKCCACLKYHRDGICYHCSTCNYGIDQLCATFVEQNTIHHPSHSHPLFPVSAKPGLNECFLCGKKHEGHFYQCTTCFNFLVNSDCLSLPIKLSLHTQQFSHRHPLTLSYSLLDQLYDCECRICGVKLEDEHLIYKCSKCMYYVHPDCTTQNQIEPFMFALLPGLGKNEKNFKDVDHPNLVHLPVDDETHILSHQIFDGEIGVVWRDGKGHLRHSFHKHPLVLISNDTTTSLHDPMKRIKLLCNACIKPITKMPFYKCSKRDGSCKFVLHDWCIRLPKQLRNHGPHPQHSLRLYIFFDNLSGYKCEACGLPCNGFFYVCFECEYVIDVNCAFMPKEITHEAHANSNHLLARVDGGSSSRSKMECGACRVSIAESERYFRCTSCDFYLDCRCALHLPKTIRHKYDKHPLQLSYSPVEDHKSRYFCEVCEEELDPGKWFYHCAECAQSIHSACAPLILQSEQGANSLYDSEGVYKYINFKFGAVREFQWLHQHPMSLALGTENDGLCGTCKSKLQSHVIWKCLHCDFFVHWYHAFPEVSPENPPRYIYIYEENEGMIKQRGPQTSLEFYPSEMMRPVTRHWKVVDDDDIEKV
ncbi:putative chromatin regulator PHD family [Helianthus annuus]|nr:putative chromatin regulator PHD family [Helianthus annuus]